MLFSILRIVGGTLLAGSLIGIAISAFVDEGSLSKEVHNRYPEALKILIQEKKKKAIKVGIFGKKDKKIESGVEISSSKGVSDNLYVGQEIYL